MQNKQLFKRVFLRIQQKYIKLIPRTTSFFKTVFAVKKQIQGIFAKHAYYFNSLSHIIYE